MSVLQDFKDAVQVGAVFEVENHVYPELSGLRTVTTSQTARAAWTIPEGHPRAGTPSWFDYPKASHVERDDDGFRVFRDWDEPRSLFFTCRLAQVNAPVST